MTARNLGSILKRFWRVVLALTLVFAAAVPAFSILLSKPVFVAEASLFISEPSGGISTANLISFAQPIAQEECSSLSEENLFVSVSPESGSSPKSLVFRAEGSIENEVVNLVNRAVAATRKKIDASLLSLEEKRKELLSADTSDERQILVYDPDFSFEYIICAVEEASSATDEAPSLAKMVLAGGLVGFFLALAILIVIDCVRKPIKDTDDIGKLVPLPCVEAWEPKRLGARIRTVLYARLGEGFHSVALVPLSEGESEYALSLIDEPIPKQGFAGSTMSDCSFAFVACEPLSVSSDAMLASCEADAALILVRLWQDTRSDLEATISELALSSANVIAVVIMH